MNKVIFNTFKVTLASIVSIMLANLLDLDFYISAGIVTILTIQSTKKHTIMTALERLIAFLIALVIAYVSFYIFGFSILGYGVYLLIYIFVCQYYKWYTSMAVNSVLISHFLTFEAINLTTVFNELALFFIGVGIGIIANLHLRKNKNAINELKNQADEQIKYIVLRMSERIVQKVDRYDGNCFEKLNHLISAAKIVSDENDNNALIFKDPFDKAYIKMREHQTQILFEMYKLIRKLHTTPITAQIISDFLKKIANEYHVKNDCKDLLEAFYKIDSKMKDEPLPAERKEFEDRARLFSLLRLIEEFLDIKKEFYNRYLSNNHN